MAEKLLKTDIPFEKGFLYFCKRSNNDFIEVWKAEMAQRRKKRGGK